MSLTPDRTDLHLTRLGEDEARCERMRAQRDVVCEQRLTDGAHQPRERSVPCRSCRVQPTRNFHAVCVGCSNADLDDGRCPRCADDAMAVVWPELADLDATSDRFPLGLAVSA